MPSPPQLALAADSYSQAAMQDELMCAIQRTVNVQATGLLPQNDNSTFQSWTSATGVDFNHAGDLSVFLGAMSTDIGAIILGILVFSVLRSMYPQMYANNVRLKSDGGLETAPFAPSDTFFGWMFASWSLRKQDMDTAGLDRAMLLRFSELSMRLLAAIGCPALCILCPVHYFGGHEALLVGDRLGSLGINNIPDGSWIFLVHGLYVCYVVVIAEHIIFKEMRKFLPRRFEWLFDATPPRSTTILVEGIPEAQRSDVLLKEYFDMLFPGGVASAYVVKHTEEVKAMIKKLNGERMVLEKLLHSQSQESQGISWTQSLGLSNDPDDESENLRRHIEVLEENVRNLQRYIMEVSDAPPLEYSDKHGKTHRQLSRDALAVNCCAGFVTFQSEREALLALELKITPDMEEFVLSNPPAPADVIYADLMCEPGVKRLYELCGYGCIFGVFMSYMPFIIGISQFTNFNRLKSHIAVFAWIAQEIPHAGIMIEGFLSTAALTLFMSFLPALLMFIFRNFFCLKARAWAQLKLQHWYFSFMCVYIVFISAVGGEPLGKLLVVIDHPREVFPLLSESLPKATHFYLSFVMVQWFAHSLNLTRYVQLSKYLCFRNVISDARAVELAEPEDQDYFGMGSRSARWSNILMIAIIFSSLSPLITLIAFVNFVLCRLYYGYLIIFAETKKPDLGGVFFVCQLWHLQMSVFLYILVMLSIFLQRSDDKKLLGFIAIALLYFAWCVWRFHKGERWERLPFGETCTPEAVEQAQEEMLEYKRCMDEGMSNPYRQPELQVSATRCGVTRRATPSRLNTEALGSPIGPSPRPSPRGDDDDFQTWSERRTPLRPRTEKGSKTLNSWLATLHT